MVVAFSFGLGDPPACPLPVIARSNHWRVVTLWRRLRCDSRRRLVPNSWDFRTKHEQDAGLVDTSEILGFLSWLPKKKGVGVNRLCEIIIFHYEIYVCEALI